MNTFEEKIARLEELSDKIRNPEIGIEEALETFEEGIKLSKTLEKELEKIEGKIQILMNSPLDEKAEESEKTVTEKEQKTKNKSDDALKNSKSEKKEFDEEDLQLDLFEEMSAPTEGLRQNG